jgi:hypothetical protein
MRPLLHTVLPALLPLAAAAQSVLPPFNAIYQIATIGPIAGIVSYGGTAFSPNNPNVLLIAPYTQAGIFSVPLTRNSQGFITAVGSATQIATLGGTDGGLAIDPTGVMFATWFGPNNLSQVAPGGTTAARVDGLTVLGVSSSVGTCAFVPAGLPGAGRFKVASWSAAQVYDLPLTPDGNGTFAPGTAGAGAAVTTGPEGMVYMPTNAPLLGGQLLLIEWGSGTIGAYQIDAIGDPVPGSRQAVAGGFSFPGGGAIDPVTGDMVFLQGTGELLAIRNAAACGSLTTYGTASPGALGTPTLTGNGCARLGQTVALNLTGPNNGLGLLALGFTQTSFSFQGLQVLQSLDATFGAFLDAAGNLTIPFPIPVNPLLGNVHVYAQTAFLDASTPAGLIASAGLDIEIR